MHYLLLLKKMMTDMEKAPAKFQPTHFWKTMIPFIVQDIFDYGFENFKSTPTSSLWISVEKPEIGLKHYTIFHEHDNGNKAPDLQQFSEDTTGNHPKLFTFNNHNYSPNALSYLKGLVFLKKHLDTPIHNVLEIGGGYGVLGEILLKADKNIFYVDIDIPPTAAISTYYLQTVFGKDAILDYNQSSQMDTLDINEIRKHYRGMVLCPWQLPKLKGQFELAVNFVSFQEMEPEVVKNYAEYISALTSHFILLRNSRHGKQIAQGPDDLGVIKQIRRDDYLEFFSSFKLAALDCKTFGYYTPTGFESEVMLLQKKD